MSWHCLNLPCSAEQEEDFSLQNYLDGIRLERSRSRSTQEKSFCKDSETESLSHSQSGMMSVPLTEDHGKDLSMSSQEGSPAKISQPLKVKVKDLPEAVQVYGSSIRESLARLNLALSSRKTVRTCVPKDLVRSSKDLPAWGMELDGECWELGTSVRITKEIECGYLPTPTCQEIPRPKAELTPCGKRRYTKDKVDSHSLSLTDTVMRMYPTPTKRDYKGRNGPEGLIRKDGKSRMDQLPNAVAYLGGRTTPQSGHLNPEWTEWLMGWPIGWTGLKPLATAKYQEWLQQHSNCSHKD